MKGKNREGLPLRIAVQCSGFPQHSERLSDYPGHERDREIANALLSRGEGTAVAPWRLHDLRRTVATGMQARKVPREVVEAVLNHVSALRGTIVGVYQCYEYHDEKRAALRKWGRHIATITAA
jgi:hypothetical protein